MAEQPTIFSGKVHIYRRPDTLWQCSTYLAGKNRRSSTKEESLSKAKDVAECWYLKLCGKFRSGEIRNEKTSARFLNTICASTTSSRRGSETSNM